MKPNLAKTSFESGSDERLAAPDVYANPEQSPVGATRDSLGSTSSIPGMDKVLGGGSSPLNKLSDKLKAFDKNGQLAKAISTATTILKGDKAALTELKTGMVNDLLKSAGYGSQVQELAGALVKGEKPLSALENMARNNPNLKVVMEGVDMVVEAKNIGSVEDLMRVAEKITGLTGLGELLHITPQLSMLKTLVDKANELRLPGLASAILEQVHDPEDRKLLDINAAWGAAAGSNLPLLTQILDKHGAQNVIGLYPTIVTALLTNYRFEEKDAQPTQAKLQALLNLCTRLDSSWRIHPRGPIHLDHLEPFMTLSADAKSLLMLDDTLRVLALTASGYSKLDLLSIAAKQYPYTPILLSA